MTHTPNKPTGSQTDWEAFSKDLKEWVKKREAKRASHIKSEQAPTTKTVATFVPRRSGKTQQPVE